MLAGTQTGGNAEGGVAVALGGHLVDAVIGRVAADDDEGVHPVVLQGPAERVQILGARHLAPGAERGAALAGEPLGLLPVELVDLAGRQPDEPVVDPDDVVAAGDAEPGEAPGRGVHAGRRAAGVHDRDPLVPRNGDGAHRLGDLAEDGVHLDEGAPPHPHRAAVVAGGDELGHVLGVGDGLHQGDPVDPVRPGGDHPALGIGGRGEHLVNGVVPQPGRRPTVVGARRPAPLDVSQDGDPGVLVESVDEYLLDVVGLDRVALAVGGPLRDDDDGVAPARLAPGLQVGAHPVLPARLRGLLWNQYEVGPAGHRAHQRQVAAMAPHHLDDEGSLVAGGGRGEVVDGVDDAVQGGVGADRHVGADQVVVDRSDDPGDHQAGMLVGGLLGEVAALDQLGDQPGPLVAQPVEAGEGAVPADHHEPVDVALQEVEDGLEPPLALAHLLAPVGADDGAAAVEDRADVLPAERPDAVPAVDHPLVALVDGVDLGADAQRLNGPPI
jgi:hypothetical protein